MKYLYIICLVLSRQYNKNTLLKVCGRPALLGIVPEVRVARELLACSARESRHGLLVLRQRRAADVDRRHLRRVLRAALFDALLHHRAGHRQRHFGVGAFRFNTRHSLPAVPDD